MKQLFYLYAVFAFINAIGYILLSHNKVEPVRSVNKSILNLVGITKKNCTTITTLSILFGIDAMAGAFVIQSYLSFYFEKKYQLLFSQIGLLLFWCNIISGISGIASYKLVGKIGAMATMIFTHLPSNIFLLIVPFTSNSTVAIVLILGRFCISQMDVPARQTYVSLVVSNEERSAANGITNIARSVGISIGLALSGYFYKFSPDDFLFSMPFAIAGSVKIFYDITLGFCFLCNNKKNTIKI
eukprot:GHVR01087379.1.p1 GENE.GHVR01087379.1~~GHVR01087379.1.p1  ORF type:complete len:242 (-),score=-1.58 GHVR01087379.1:3647-4372(-)